MSSTNASNMSSPSKNTRYQSAVRTIQKAMSSYSRNNKKSLTKRNRGNDDSDEESEDSHGIPTLTARNYHTWSMKMELQLLTKGLSEYIITDEKSKIPPPDQDKEKTEYRKFRLNMQKAKGEILSRVPVSQAIQLKDKDPCEIWKELHDEHQGQATIIKQELRRKIQCFSWMSGNVAKEETRFRKILVEFKTNGGSLSTLDQLEYFLGSVPVRYETKVDEILAKMETQKSYTFNKAVQELLTKERRLNNSKALHKMNQPNNTRSNNPKRSHADNGNNNNKQYQRPPGLSGEVYACTICKRDNHSTANCYRNKTKKGAAANLVSNKSNQSPDNEPSTRYEALTVEILHVSATSVTESCPDKKSWIVDSGCTKHICNDRDQFINLNDKDMGEYVVAAEGGTAEIKGRGTVKIETGLRTLHLHDTLYVPALQRNLLSVGHATEKGASFTFAENSMHLQNSAGDTIAIATKRGSLYHIDADAATRHRHN